MIDCLGIHLAPPIEPESRDLAGQGFKAAATGLFRVVSWVLNGLELDVHNATIESDANGMVRLPPLLPPLKPPHKNLGSCTQQIDFIELVPALLHN